MENQFTFNTETGKCKGAFNIYQGKNGAIYILIASSPLQLSKEQVEELSIDIYSLKDFSHNDYEWFYGTK